MGIPILDMSHFLSGNQAEREIFVSSFLGSLSESGFVKIIRHGIDEEEVAKIFQWNKRFFEISEEEKRAIAHPGGSAPQRGYSAIGSESTAGLYRKGLLNDDGSEFLIDAREHWDQGAQNDDEYPNRWPTEALPDFRPFMEETRGKFEKIANQLMRALEIAYKLPEGAFTDKITQEASASEFRFVHYPSIDIATLRDGKTARVWPHFDLGVITLLFQDQQGGLQCEDRDKTTKEGGAFQPIEPGHPTELVVNVSETLQRWTNGELPAGLHQVTLPEALGAAHQGVLPDRYSVAYFCKADRSASVGPLSQFVPDGHIPKYDNVTAIHYHQQRLSSAY